jgi:hypothetical protein
MALKIGKQATSAYERSVASKSDAKSGREGAAKGEDVAAASSTASVGELVSKIEMAIERRNWRLLESFWEELRPQIEGLAMEEESEGEGAAAGPEGSPSMGPTEGGMMG